MEIAVLLPCLVLASIYLAFGFFGNYQMPPEVAGILILTAVGLVCSLLAIML